MTTLRQLAVRLLEQAGWSLVPPPVLWSPRLTRSAGLFVVTRDRRGRAHPEIRLSIPLIRRRDRAWPVEVCGCWCHSPEAILRRILEHELIHFKLWREGAQDWGHTEAFRRLAWQHFGHPSITHGIGIEEEEGGPIPPP